MYPVPDKNLAGLGVHITVDIGGQARFGPDVEWLVGRASDEEAVGEGSLDSLLEDYTVDPERATNFYDAVRRYWPALPDGSLAPDYAGIRPKLRPGCVAGRTSDGTPDGTSTLNHFCLDDFNILGPDRHGVGGVIHLLGIESPGLTASLALAEEVMKQVERMETPER